MTGITRRLALAIAGTTMFFALAGAPVAANAADPAQARQFIERSAAQVRSEAASVKASGDARTRFGALFVKSFDIDALARNVLGARWAALSPAQQGDFRTAFQAYVIKAYAERFYTYAGQPLTVLASDAAGGGTLVRTRVQMPSGTQTPVDWQVSEAADGLRISDVAIDGVSLTRTHRDEFTSVIQANGGDVGKLTAMLQERSR